jgi:hypothetical protein
LSVLTLNRGDGKNPWRPEFAECWLSVTHQLRRDKFPPFLIFELQNFPQYSAKTSLAFPVQP